MAQKPLTMFATSSLICSNIAAWGPQVSPLHRESNVHLSYGSIKNLISHSPERQITPLSVGAKRAEPGLYTSAGTGPEREDSRLPCNPQQIPMQMTEGYPYNPCALHGHSGKRIAVV